MNRIEFITGHRWAREICLRSFGEMALPGGAERILCTLRRGLEKKPKDYSDGVQEIITMVEDAQMAKVLEGKV